jgi:hypothetical protein
MLVQTPKQCALVRLPNRAMATRRTSLRIRATAAPEAPPTTTTTKKASSSKGHSALMHGLGDVGLIPAQMMPLILRIGASF